MSSNEINPGNGLESGVRSSAGLPGSISDTNRDRFEQQLSKAHSSLGGIPIDPLLESDDGFNAGASYDGSVNGASSRRNEFESGIPSIDFVARQVGKVLDVVDKTVEEGASVRQFISETTAHVSEVIHERADVARRNWNAPDNELREVLTDRLQRGVGFLKKLSASLSENPDARELMDNAITVGRNLAEKTSDAIQNAQFATESFLEGVHNEVYGKSSLPLGQASSRDRQAHPSVGVIDLGHPFVGVIDTGFEAQDHGTQVVSVIQEVGHQFPDWLANSVGSGTWSESLVNFADAARASERFNAVANLSFDLTQLNSDGSISTRYEFTTEEREALKYAQANGVLVVVSAGNQGGTMSALGQASQEFDNVIAVGASEGGQRADYSSYGSGLDFVASGQGKAEVEGTSLAAARVTGAIARIWDANSQLDYRQVIQTLEATATDLQQPGWDHETGFGQLNPSAAIKLAEGLASQPQGSLTSPVLQNLSEKHQINQDIPSGSVWQQSNDAILIERPNSLIAGNAASYPGYSLKFNPSAPEYNEAPAVVRIWQQRMNDLGYKINVDGQ